MGTCLQLQLRAKERWSTPEEEDEEAADGAQTAQLPGSNEEWNTMRHDVQAAERESQAWAAKETQQQPQQVDPAASAVPFASPFRELTEHPSRVQRRCQLLPFLQLPSSLPEAPQTANLTELEFLRNKWFLLIGQTHTHTRRHVARTDAKTIRSDPIRSDPMWYSIC
jgi:hypothetical protein